MDSRRVVTVVRWLSTFAALAGIVLVYRRWLHANPTTVALTLVLYVLLVAAQLSLRYAVVASVAATALFNYFFLPPIGTFTIGDPQNWLALFAFLSTSVIGSRLSHKARAEAWQARRGKRELEVLFALSRELLQTDNVAELVNTVPILVNVATRAESTTLYLLEGDRIYQAGLQRTHVAEPLLQRELALTLQEPEIVSGAEARIPLRTGVRPRGLLRLVGPALSADTLQAIGGLASIAIDRAQALEEVARNEANRESERLRTLILDSITHELRTPLTSIKGAIGTLQLGLEKIEPEQREELLTIIEEEADRMNRLVGEAVELAQIETQEVHMQFAPTDLRGMVREAEEHCSQAMLTHPVTVNIPDLPKVNADPAMVVKVLSNLLDNAAKYSERGAPIFVSAERKNGSVVVSVADRGIGIDPMEQGLIFDKLYRSRSSQGTPGTGMGLPISRAIVEAHHGELTVTSQAGQGSVFSFSLPIFDRDRGTNEQL